MEYVVAIPSYQRPIAIEQKTLKTLKDGGVSPDKIYIFVASNEEYDKYFNKIDKNLYHQIIVGELGIRNQRVFISKFFKDQTKIVSCDDDIEEFHFSTDKKTKIKIENVDGMFKQNFTKLSTEPGNAHLWGLYPVSNPYFMNNTVRTGLYFCIGCCFGYINRHDDTLYPDPILNNGKEDIETSILFYLRDKKILRYDYISFKTKFNSVGGMGKYRFKEYEIAANYLEDKYPNLCTKRYRKNGLAEIKLKNNHTFEVAVPELI